MLTLSACAPDNIIASPEIITPDSEQADTTTDTLPETSTEVETETDTAPETETETDTETETETEDSAENNIIYEGKQPNTEVAPGFTLTNDTTVLNGKEIVMYTTDESAFNAGDMNEKQWFDALKEEYGLTVNHTYINNNVLYATQLLALKSGKKLDVISAKINDLTSSLSLMRSAEGFVTPTQTPFYSKTVFEKSGNRVFTGKGNSRMLWYNADLISDDSPFTLYSGDRFTTDVLSALQLTYSTKNARFIECNNWISFGSVGTEQVTGVNADAFAIALASDNSINAFTEFANIVNKDDKKTATGHEFDKGNTLFKMTEDPGEQSFKLSFVPLPKYTTDGSYVAEFCGTGLGISKTADDETAAYVTSFLTLWSARYTESRADRLIKLLGEQKAEQYLTASEEHGKLTNADAKIAQTFNGEVISEALFSDGKTIYDTYSDAYNRAAALNARLK